MNAFLALFLALYYVVEAFVLFFIPKRLRFKRIDNDIVCITGGGSGLGRALAVHFAKQGCRKVVLWDLNNEGLQESLRLVQKEGAKCWTYICDVTDRNKVYELARKVEEEVGPVNMLVNNAGIISGKKHLENADESIIRTFHVNAISHFWTSKAFLPGMIAKNYGHIVSIASLAGLGGNPRLSDYCASKYAAVGFEESLRMELKVEGHDGIHSTVVCPYYINTGMFSGVDTGAISLLETEDVAWEVIKAVLTNQEVLYVPTIFYFLFCLKTMFPTKAFWIISHHIFKVTHSMDSFVGRKQGANESKKAN